jgi:hypothetical protein
MNARRSVDVKIDGRRETLLVEQAGPETDFCLDIEINERAGLVRVHDPRLFQAAQHAFCKRLLAAASEQREIRRAEVSLATATCWIQFGPGLDTSQALASAFILAVRQASVGTTGKVRRPWWQRLKDAFRRKGYRGSDGCVPWEALELEPGRIAIDVQGLKGDPDRIARLTRSLTGLEAVDVRHVLPWSGRIAIHFRPERPGLDRLLDGVERALLSIQGERRTVRPLRVLRGDWARVLLRFLNLTWIKRLPDLSSGNEARQGIASM